MQITDMKRYKDKSTDNNVIKPMGNAEKCTVEVIEVLNKYNCRISSQIPYSDIPLIVKNVLEQPDPNKIFTVRVDIVEDINN